jgi:predicted PurR-regulated permease PerM
VDSDRSAGDRPDEILAQLPPIVTVRGLSLSALAMVSAVLVLREAAGVVVPVLISALLAYALAPAVDRLVAWSIPRPLAALIVYALLGVAAAIAWREVRDRTAGFLEDLPETIAAVQQSFESDSDAGPIDRLREAAQAMERARSAVAPPARPGVRRITVVRPHFDAREYMVTITHGVLGTSIQVVVVAILTFLILTTGDLFREKLVRLAGPRLADRRATLQLLDRIDRQIERYLLARLLISGIVAAATGLSIYLLGVNHAFAWGVIAGALNVMPFIGPTVAVALIAMAAFVQFNTIAMAAAAGAAAVVVAAVEGNVITPLLMSRAGELNTVAVFVSVLAWGWMWDMWGLLLAVPIMVAVKAAADHIEPLKPIGELLGR